MYEIHHRRWFNDRFNYRVVGRTSLLCQARDLRRVTGDLVVGADGLVVDSQWWLWEWEQHSPDCYAQRAIKYDRALREGGDHAMHVW